MKTCSSCKIEKPFSEFYKNKAKKDGYNTACKECRAVYIRQHYKANKKYYIDKAHVSRDKIRDFWRQYKGKLVCNRCKFSHPAALDFHHTDPTQKDFNISSAIRDGLSVAKILVEIDKCEILCANCHRIEHYG